MRKFVTFLTTGLLALVCCTTIVSAKSNLDVYYTGERSAKTTYTVSVMTSGKATNGVTEITYDAEALVCDEADVIISAKVDLYSVNIEDGVVKISYIAENSLPAGKFITVSFDVTETYADEEVSADVSCISYDKKGNELTTGPKVEDKRPANNGNSGDYEEDENQQPAEDKDNAGNKKQPGKNEEGKKPENKKPVTNEESVENVQTEQVTQTEETEQSVQTEVIADEEVPLASEAVQTAKLPVVAIVLAIVCVVAVAVVFVTKKKKAE